MLVITYDGEVDALGVPREHRPIALQGTAVGACAAATHTVDHEGVDGARVVLQYKVWDAI